VSIEPQPGEHSGFVALVGWTNVGKSTLLNRLVGVELAAVGQAAQTTRRRLVAVLTLPGRGQLAFIDTPGLHDPRHRMNQTMVEVARRSAAEGDVTALVIDAACGIGPGDRRAAELVSRSAATRVAVLNKIDLVRPRTLLLPLMAELGGRLGFADVVPVSASTGEGTAELLTVLLNRLPSGPAPYPADFLTDQPESALVAEWIREKLLTEMREELPHVTAVVVDRWVETDTSIGRVDIEASILVERDSQKKIVIGRGGTRIRDVGTAARLEIERRIGRPVFLRLWVRTRRDWRDDARVLRELGVG